MRACHSKTHLIPQLGHVSSEHFACMMSIQPNLPRKAAMLDRILFNWRSLRLIWGSANLFGKPFSKTRSEESLSSWTLPSRWRNGGHWRCAGGSRGGWRWWGWGDCGEEDWWIWEDQYDVNMVKWVKTHQTGSSLGMITRPPYCK